MSHTHNMARSASPHVTKEMDKVFLNSSWGRQSENNSFHIGYCNYSVITGWLEVDTCISRLDKGSANGHVCALLTV